MSARRKSGLTINQELFCIEYLIDRNATRAYKTAYTRCKKDNTAATEGSKLLRNPKIKGFMDAELAKLARKSEVTAGRVLEEEGRLAFSDLGQLFEGETTIPPGELPEDIRRALAGIEVTERWDPNAEGMVKTYKYKLWDKGAALNRLHKHLGTYKPEGGDLAGGIEKLADRLGQALERVGAQ